MIFCNEQKKKGVAVVFIGEDLDVLMQLSDRIMVMCGGKVSGIVDPRKVTKEEIGYENGVLGGLVSALNAFASHGDGVLVHSPTYIGFTKSIEGAGYRIVHSRMKRDEQGVWRMDYEDMDAKLKENKIHVAVFCNPHNPTGRVWEPEEIQKAMEVYKENDCIVIADEIWSDLILERIPSYTGTVCQ